MKLRYSLSILYAQIRALFHRLVYRRQTLTRFMRRALQILRVSFYALLQFLHRSLLGIIAWRRPILLGIGSFIILVLLALLIYRYQVSHRTKLYHQIFYIEPLFARFTSEPNSQPKLPPPHPLLVKPYKVVEGDTYWDIAKKTGVYLDTLISYNKPKDIFKVRPQETINVPLQDGILYQRTSNETPEEVGRRYAIAPENIIYFNPNWKSETNLFVPGAYFSYVERLKKLGAEFANPLSSFFVTSSFGNRIHPLTKKRSFHKGIDLRAAIGTPVYAASGGTVIAAREAPGYGNIVMIHHGNSKFTRYAHLLSFSVRAGQKVVRGQPIGKVGSSGLSTGPHLHFEVWKQNKPTNPIGVTDFFSKSKK